MKKTSQHTVHPGSRREIKVSKLEILLVCGLLLLPACRRNKGSEQETSDSAITSQIEDKLQQDATLKTRTIHVTAQQGTVTLSGEVANDSEKVTAEKLLEDASGAKQIIDLLAVAQVQSSPTQSRQEIASGPKPPARNPQARASTQSTEQPRNLPPVEEESANTTAQQPTQTVAPVVNVPQPPPQPVTVSVPAGTQIVVRMIDSIDSDANQAGQTFAASVSTAVGVGNQVVIPQGSDAHVRLEEEHSAGHFRGRSRLKVELVSVTANGTTYALETDPVEKQGASRGANTAEKVGAGAVVGSVIGGILNHGKGVVTGARLGVGAGAADQGLTHSKKVKIASEERLVFALRGPLTVQVPAAGSTNR